MIEVGTALKGFCHGAFGRDSYTDKRVEAYGADWVLVREADSHGRVDLYRGSRQELAALTLDCDCDDCKHAYGRCDQATCCVCEEQP